MNEKNFILATAGHVDHGKSALVKALTGIEPDRLAEEKARGITIELGFAPLVPEIPGGVARVGIIDVPGHEDFVKNMVAGVGAIDLALLVVAADDGWMPQSEEHLQILSYLGVKRAVVALTKIDATESENEIEESIRARLQGSPFAQSPIVKTSLPSGRGLDELKTTLAQIFAAMIPSPDIGKPRLAVDRAFTLRGIGTVVTGTLSGGKFRVGEEIVVQPQKIPARIRAIQNHGRDLNEINPGMRTALSLPDATNSVRRGDTITLEKFGDHTVSADVLLNRSPRLSPRTPALKNGATAQVHHGSSTSTARIALLDREKLDAGEQAIARLHFAQPQFLFVGDRFVVRDASSRWTLAGGVVLDELALTNFRSAEQRDFLTTRTQAFDSAEIFVETLVARERFLLGDALLRSRFGEDEIAEAVVQLEKRERVVSRSDLLIDGQWWTQLRQRASDAIDEAHQLHPNRAGLDLRELRKILPGESTSLFDTLVAELCRSDFSLTENVIRRARHQPTLPANLRAAATKIRAALAAKPFDPPPRQEIAATPNEQLALNFLRDTKEIVEINSAVFLTHDAFMKMREFVIKCLREHGPATASEVRKALGSSRRVIIPFLERLDRDGVTRRQEDKRVLANSAPA